MGCFASACFGNYKKHKVTAKKCHCKCNQKQSNEIQEAMKLLAPPTKSIEDEKSVNPNLETEIKSDEQMRNINKEELSLDYSNIKTHMDGVTIKAGDNPKNGYEGEEKNREQEKDEVAVTNLIPDQENHKDQNFFICDKENLSVQSNGANFITNSKLDFCLVDEESSESLFSLSIDSRKHVSTIEIGDREVCSPLKEINSFSSNIIGKRNKKKLDEEEDKENVNLQENLILPLMSKLQSVALESGKLTHKTSIINGNSPESQKNYEDGQILGIEERKQLKEETSYAEDPCGGGGDDQPGIGTIGSYWLQICRQTGRAEEEKVKL